MRHATGRRSVTRQAVLVALLAAAVLAAGLALATPVWQCETLAPRADIAVVNRDCRHVPRSRALWTWIRAHAQI